MKDKLDDLLGVEGQRWRDERGPDPDLEKVLGTVRNGTRRRPALLTAAAVLVVLSAVGLIVHLTGSRESAGDKSSATTNGVQASCVAPMLSISRNAPETGPARRPTLGKIRPGQRVTLYGGRYFGKKCQDTGSLNHKTRPVLPDGSIRLSLTTADNKSRILAVARPARNAAFTAKVAIPKEAYPGHATISDDAGNTIVLTIVAN